MRNRKFILAGAAAFALAALALAAAYFYIPGGVRPHFEEGDIRVCLNADGTILLDWPQARLEPLPENGEDGGTPAEGDGPAGAPPDAVYYDLDVQSGDRRVQKLQGSPGVLLDALPLPMTVRVQAVVEGKNLLGIPRRLTSQTLIAEVADADLSAPEAVGTPGPGSLALSWKQPGQVP